jgi:hypothetical protein
MDAVIEARSPVCKYEVAMGFAIDSLASKLPGLAEFH